MRKTLLLPAEVDELLRYPRGRSARLARADIFPHIRLPDGQIRFDPGVINRILVSTNGSTAPEQGEVAPA